MLRTAHRHDAKLPLLSLDPIAEYVTSLITERLAAVPHVTLPAGTLHRSAVKLAVDTVLRGPQSSLLTKFLEELLNPDLGPAVAQARSAALEALLPRTSPTSPDPDADRLGEQILAQLQRKELPRMVDWFDPGRSRGSGFAT